MNPILEQFIELRIQEFDQIEESRKIRLDALSRFITSKLALSEPIKIIVICTHNSRRSHMGQLWLAAAAQWYGLSKIETYSGGTEATAFHPNAVNALRNAGFDITTHQNRSNSYYKVSLGEDIPSLLLFSKPYFHEFNPQRNFAAIMVCNDADEACPVVIGAAARFSLAFDDPKSFDGTPLEAEKYNERSMQIAREMLYAISKVGQ
jgi:hypothetical protein